MKLSALFLVGAALAAITSALNGAPQPTAAPAAVADAPREFRVTLRQIVPGGEAIANGGFYALNTAPAKPLGGNTGLDPQKREPAGSQRGWTPVGDIYVTGLPEGYADGERWNGWMVREGTKTFTTALGTYRTLPSYRIAQEPALPAAAPAKWKPAVSVLDKPARR